MPRSLSLELTDARVLDAPSAKLTSQALGRAHELQPPNVGAAIAALRDADEALATIEGLGL